MCSKVAESKYASRRASLSRAAVHSLSRVYCVFDMKGTLFVLANSEKGAIDCALYNFSEENSIKTRARPIDSLKDVPQEWRDAVPWEGMDSYDERLADEGSTIRKILGRKR